MIDASGGDVNPRLAAIVGALFVFPALSLPALRLVSGD